MADSRALKSNPEEAIEEDEEEGETATWIEGLRGCNRNLKCRWNEAIGAFPDDETADAIMIFLRNKLFNRFQGFFAFKFYKLRIV